MGRFDALDPVNIRVGDCACAGTPHEEGDFIYLRPRLGYVGGAAALQAMGGDTETLPQRLVPVYITHGAMGWNFLDDEGEPVPFDVQRILDDWELAYEVADKADDLYSERVLAPLAKRVQDFLPPTRTNGSTSARRRGSSKHPKPSKPSSTSTTPTDATETTSGSPDGGSSTSPNAKLVA